MIQNLFMSIPKEAYILGIAISGLLIILGARKFGFGILMSVLILAFVIPIIKANMATLPRWLFILICLILFLFMVRIVLGKGVFSHLMTMLIYDLIRVPFRFLMRCFRLRIR